MKDLDIETIKELYRADELDYLERRRFVDWMDMKYHFEIVNPSHVEAVEFDLYYCDKSKHWPVLQSNTLCISTTNSICRGTGDASNEIGPTETFWDSLAYAYNEMWAFTPVTYFEYGHFEDSMEQFYDGKVPSHEKWAISELSQTFFHQEDVIEEFFPLAFWVDHHTEFGVPAVRDLMGDE